MHSDDFAEREAEAAAAEAAAIGREPDGQDRLDPSELDGEDPAMRPVRQAGGGEAEGFEEAEEELIEHASHGDYGHSPRHDAYPPEAESDLSGAEYGEADHEEVSEREDEGEDTAPGPREEPGPAGRAR